MGNFKQHSLWSREFDRINGKLDEIIKEVRGCKDDECKAEKGGKEEHQEGTA